MKTYNPVYGALFEIDENRPADPAAVGQWVLNYTTPRQGLTPNEIAELIMRREHKYGCKSEALEKDLVQVNAE